MTPAQDRSIILLTNYFPFDKGEEYLEAELPIIASKYEDVTVIPLMTCDGAVQTRKLPDGVKLIAAHLGRNQPQRLFDLSRQLITGMSDWDGFRGSKGHTRMVDKAFDAYFESRAISVLRRLTEMETSFRPKRGVAVTLYSYWFYLTARVGVGLKNRWRHSNPVTLVSRGHGYDVNVAASAINFLPEREYLLGQVDALYPVSDSTTESFRKTYPHYSGKIHTRRLGSPDAWPREEAKQDPFHIVSCSTIRPLKRLEVIADAVELLAGSHPNLRWTHIGSANTQYAKRLISETKKRLLGVVHFEGQKSNKEVHDWYRTHPASVFVNVSTSEGVPVSIMEAMSYKLPIVATDVGGTFELFTNEMFDGLLPKHIDGGELASALKRLKAAPLPTFVEYSESSRRAWERTWNAEKNFEAFTRDLGDDTQN